VSSTNHLQAKVAGSWHLHQLTRHLELDFFVSFSSIASVLGAHGLAYYAAANHFLDALSHYRRALVLPSLSINWGPWCGGGMASTEYRHQLQRIGLRQLPAEQAVEALDALLATEASQAIVANIDWKTFKEDYAMRFRHRLFEEICPPSPPGSGGEPVHPSELRRRLAEATPVEPRQLLVEYLQAEVAQVLGFPASRRIEPQQGFFDMGMDSLMAMALKNRLEVALDQWLPPTLTFDSATVESLAAHLLEMVAPSSLAPVPMANDASSDKAIDEISHMLVGPVNQKPFEQIGIACLPSQCLTQIGLRINRFHAHGPH
jgi:aryl carrier-like protein